MIVGFFLCLHCRRSGAWDTFSKMLSSKKRTKTLSSIDSDNFGKESMIDKEVDSQWKQIKNSTCLLASLPEECVADIFRNFKLPVRLSDCLL